MVLGYLRDSDPYYEPRGVERTVAFTTERASLRGRVDRIDERPARDGSGGTELAIVDYKTGRRPLTSTDARSSLAMALYVLGARRVLHKPCTRVELHHLPTNTVAAADHDDASLARHQRRAESIADDAAAAEARWREGLTPAEADEAFPPEPSALCGWCDFARICPQGRRVAPPRDSWAGLDDPELADPDARTPADRAYQRCVRGVPAGGCEAEDNLREGLPDEREDCEQAGGAGRDAALRGDRIRAGAAADRRRRNGLRGCSTGSSASSRRSTRWWRTTRAATPGARTTASPSTSGSISAAEDALALIDEVAGDEPAYVLGSSSGAITGLELITRHPDRVRMLVAHEPPCVEVLPDAETRGRSSRTCTTPTAADGARGGGACCSRSAPGWTRTTLPPPEDLLPEFRELIERMHANAGQLLQHKLLPFTRYQPDLDALKRVARQDRPGRRGGRRGAPARRGRSSVIADHLGWPVVTFPGGHGGYASHPVPFATSSPRVLRPRSPESSATGLGAGLRGPARPVIRG